MATTKKQSSQNVAQNTDKIYGNIIATKNYDQFGYISGNREINQTNYTKLEKSMLEEQLIIPICVNDKMKIIDGQHRFEVAKNNNLPVYYYVVKDYQIDQVKRANMVSRNWTKRDFLYLQMDSQKDAYVIFGYLVETYAVGIQDLLKVFSVLQKENLGLISKKFEEGSFCEDGCDKAEDFLKALESFNMFRYYKTSPFVTAFIKLYFQERYDHKKMIERLARRANALAKRGTIDEYLVLLTRDIYSFGAVRNPINYDQATKKFY